jgi:Domain of unknown function (DUF4062)
MAVRAMNVKYQIFVSSTYEDLKDERAEVIKACLNLGHIPVDMEMSNAAISLRGTRARVRCGEN